MRIAPAMRHGSNQPRSGGPLAAMRASRGFTLVEMVAVMAITAVIAAGVAVFLRLPLQTYQDIQRRTAISDTADTVFGYLKRDLQTALPNSVRVTNAGLVYYLELLQTRTGGRYRAEAPSSAVATGANTCPDTNADGFADENVMVFGVADTCFTTLGTTAQLSSIAAPNADFVVIYNLGPGFPDADAYETAGVTGGNKSVIASAAAGAGGENVIQFASNTFKLESPSRRFHVVSGPVSYVCDPTAGTLRRITAYTIVATQPPAPVGTSVILAKGVTGCTMTYDQNVINRRAGIVSIWLRFADPALGTTETLFQQIQVTNDP